MSAAPSVTANAFRDVIGRFATGVTVITALDQGRRFGTTASAVSSLSLEPPMLLVCMNESSATGQAIARAGSFGVNILGEEQAELARRFAGKGDDKFAGVGLEYHDGAPRLEGALATVECRVVEVARGGTHVVFIGEVLHAAGREGAPLAYFRGGFHRLTAHDLPR